jgi:hypothetical protein
MVGNSRVGPLLQTGQDGSSLTTFVRSRYDERNLSLNIEFSTSNQAGTNQLTQSQATDLGGSRISMVGGRYGQGLDPEEVVRISASITARENDRRGDGGA